jgi:hypothetical protein
MVTPTHTQHVLSNELPYFTVFSYGGIKSSGENASAINHTSCHNPILRECKDETHTPEMGTWGVLYIIKKLSKCRC